MELLCKWGKKKMTKKQTITIQYDEYQGAPRSVSIMDNSQLTAVRSISEVSSSYVRIYKTH